VRVNDGVGFGGGVGCGFGVGGMRFAFPPLYLA
jgi:hypothetical protein